MTREEYEQLVEAIAAIGRFHQATTPAHLTRDCDFCQSLDERRVELAQQFQLTLDKWLATPDRGGQIPRP